MTALEIQIDRAEQLRAAARDSMAAALERYRELMPAVPAEILTPIGGTSPWSQFAEMERDAFGHTVLQRITRSNGQTIEAPRRIVRAENIEAWREHATPAELRAFDRSRAGRELKRIHAIAKDYDTAARAAFDQAGFAAAEDVESDASRAAWQLLDQALALPAPATLRGAAARARALGVFSAETKGKGVALAVAIAGDLVEISGSVRE